MRADEHEGDLADSDVKRAADQMIARSREIRRNDLADLTESGAFLRWLWVYAKPLLTQNFPVNNGSLLAHFMGKREMVLQMIEEMEVSEPGFTLRLMEAGRDLEKTLEAAVTTPPKEK